ncbi:MAG: response regulator [Planctomycetota bacterium]
MNLLIIDDEIALVESLSKYLQKHGYQIKIAYNGQEGLELFLKEPQNTHLILMDLQTPLLHGLAFLKQIREKQFNVPVILMSGYIDENSQEEAQKLGVIECLLKPFKLAQLKSALEKNAPSDIS